MSVDAEQSTPETVRKVLALLDESTTADRVAPLSEQAVLALKHGAPETTHVVARTADGDPVGYLQLVEDAEATAGELIVSPTHRRRGVGAALAAWALARAARGQTLRAWAHGDGEAAAALAKAFGFHADRVLLQMRRPANAPLPAARTPAGVRIRSFRPGDDDEAWVEVNARAFADHPEQGRLRVEDLRARMAELWFDPAGFFVADRTDSARPDSDRLVGFHWTKVHERPEPLGEVYVVGVDPDERGTGLGRALTVAGLEHLVAAGVPTLMLYADESNTPAVRMYERLGFTIASTDVMYQR